MDNSKEYLEKNRSSWNARTPIHLNSEFYSLAEFKSGISTLKEIELPLLGDVKGLKILHLQCHFGQDSLSLSHIGAQVTGVDLSDAAIAKARELNDELNLDAKFICCDIFDLPNHLDEQFDIVFTSYGVITWLPELDTWAKVIQGFLKKGGKFVMAEFHPFIWTFDEKLSKIDYSYFNDGVIIEKLESTYGDPDHEIKGETDHCWNHSLAETIGSLLSTGLTLTHFDEHNYSPYDCFENLEEFSPGRFRFKHLKHTIPMVYSLVCTKGK